MSDCRYRLYELRNGEPHLIAEADDAAGVGMALITIGQESRDAGAPLSVVGILDWHAHKWVTSCWTPHGAIPFH